MYSTYHRICPSRAEFQEFRLSLCSHIVCRRETTLDSLGNLFRSLVPNQASHVCHELEDWATQKGENVHSNIKVTGMSIRAIYEDGVLRALERLPIKEGTEVDG